MQKLLQSEKKEQILYFGPTREASVWTPFVIFLWFCCYYLQFVLRNTMSTRTFHLLRIYFCFSDRSSCHEEDEPYRTVETFFKDFNMSMCSHRLYNESRRLKQYHLCCESLNKPNGHQYLKSSSARYANQHGCIMLYIIMICLRYGVWWLLYGVHVKFLHIDGRKSDHHVILHPRTWPFLIRFIYY